MNKPGAISQARAEYSATARGVAMQEALEQALEKARDNYISNHPASAAAMDDAANHMPGGNTRTVLFHTPFPLRIVSATGNQVRDADGFEYVNFLGEYTAGLFGHNNPVIRRAIDEALDRGVNLSGHNPDEARLAEIVCSRFPALDKVRFTNSGTEANLMAISTARYSTGRSKVLVFEGAYHGGLLYFRGGGNPINAPFDYVLCSFNNVTETRNTIRENASELACVLVEPMQGASGCIPASQEFLDMLSTECSQSGAVLIFDEVMTSRITRSGAQGFYDIVPDMCTLGKYIGGGMTFGAFGGREELMSVFDPRKEGALPHAGTFNNNSLTMAAGVAAMGEVLTDDNLTAINRLGDEFRRGLNRIALKYNAKLQFTGIGSIIGMHGIRAEVTSTQVLVDADDGVLELVFLDMVDRGYYFARRGFISLMLTIGDKETRGFLDSFEAVLSHRKVLLEN